MLRESISSSESMSESWCSDILFEPEVTIESLVVPNSCSFSNESLIILLNNKVFKYINLEDYKIGTNKFIFIL